MYKHQIQQAIRQLHEIEGLSFEQVQELATTYPYFQTAHLLLAKKAKNEGVRNLKTVLSKVATVIPNREVLYRYLFFDRMPLADDLPPIQTTLQSSVNHNDVLEMDEESVQVPLPTETEDVKPQLKQLSIPQEQETAANIVLAAEEKEEDLIETHVAQEVTLVEVDEQDTSKIRLDTAIITAEAIAKVEREIELERHQLEAEQKELLKGNAKNKNMHLIGEAIKADVDADLAALKKLLDDQYAQQEEIEQSVAKDEDLLQLLQQKVDAYQQSKQSLESWEGDAYQQANNGTPIVEKEQTTANVASLSEEDEREIKDYVSRYVDEDIDQLVVKGKPEDSDTEPIILSETMAKVYARQGHTDKAINIYRQLILKYPEKRPYFAGKIDELLK